MDLMLLTLAILVAILLIMIIASGVIAIVMVVRTWTSMNDNKPERNNHGKRHIS